MSLTLMSSRLALAIQYGVATVYALRHNHGATALLIHTLTMVGAACAYLGVSAGSRHFAGKILIRCIALLQFPERCCAENIRSMVCMPCHQIFWTDDVDISIGMELSWLRLLLSWSHLRSGKSLVLRKHILWSALDCLHWLSLARGSSSCWRLSIPSKRDPHTVEAGAQVSSSSLLALLGFWWVISCDYEAGFPSDDSSSTCFTCSTSTTLLEMCTTVLFVNSSGPSCISRFT